MEYNEKFIELRKLSLRFEIESLTRLADVAVETYRIEMEMFVNISIYDFFFERYLRQSEDSYECIWK